MNKPELLSIIAKLIMKKGKALNHLVQAGMRLNETMKFHPAAEEFYDIVKLRLAGMGEFENGTELFAN